MFCSKESFALDRVKIFIALMDKKTIGVSAKTIYKNQDNEVTFTAENVFIHPLLGTAEVS